MYISLSETEDMHVSNEPVVVALFGSVDDDYYTSNNGMIALPVTVAVGRKDESYEVAFTLYADPDTREGDIFMGMEPSDGITVLGFLSAGNIVEVMEVIVTDRCDENMEWYRTVENEWKYGRDADSVRGEWTMFNCLEPLAALMEEHGKTGHGEVGDFDIDSAMFEMVYELEGEEAVESTSTSYYGELWLMTYELTNEAELSYKAFSQSRVEELVA